MPTYDQIRHAVRERESELLREVLERHAWVLTRAAAELEIQYSTLHDAIARHPRLVRDRKKRGLKRGRPHKSLESLDNKST